MEKESEYETFSDGNGVIWPAYSTPTIIKLNKSGHEIELWSNK